MAKPQRAFALVAALLLLVSTVGVSGVVIWQMNQQDQKPAESEGKLEGTKLQGFTPVSDVPELKIIDLKEGTGAVVPEGGSVVAHYTGALAKTGIIFQSSHDSGSPIPFSLNGVIQGWTKGVPGMKVGGLRRLLIPASLAYGAQGSPPVIGPNEPLVFDIEVTSLGQ